MSRFIAITSADFLALFILFSEGKQLAHTFHDFMLHSEFTDQSKKNKDTIFIILLLVFFLQKTNC